MSFTIIINSCSILFWQYHFFLRYRTSQWKLLGLVLSFWRVINYWFTFLEYNYSNLFLLVWALVDCAFEGIGPFHLKYQIHRQIFKKYSFIFFLMSMGLIVIVPLFFSDSSNLCLLSMVNLARGLSIFLIFFKRTYF